MMKMKTKLTGLSPMNGDSKVSDGDEGGPEKFELRPSGMLVQKRIDGDHPNIKLPPTIRVRVKYGSIYHDIYINSLATFGELKKMLSEPTGLHHEDQKVYYKKKERDSKEFLDFVGVKDKSKLVLVEDPISQEKRYYEMRRNAKIEKASKTVSQISLEVDKLATRVTAFESVISKGGRVAEKEVVNLIELLMNELIKLDAIFADGDVKLQKKMQVSRVQKYVETLDVLKAKNSMPSSNGVDVPNGNANNQIHTNNRERSSNGGKPPLPPKPLQRHPIGHSPLQPQPQRQTMVTTQWEMFDSSSPLIALSPTRSPESPHQKPEKPKFPWEFFDD